MRLHTQVLKDTLDGWDEGTNMTIGDMYTFTMVTGETFRFTNLQAPTLSEIPGGRLAAAATGPGATVVNIASVDNPLAKWYQGGAYVLNLSTPTSLAAGTWVTNSTPTTITLSNPVQSPGIAAGDNLSFCWYYNMGPGFSRTKTKCQVGPQIDEMEVDMLCSGNDFITLNNTSNITWQAASYYGLFDGGYCRLDRAFFSSYAGDPTGLGQCMGSVTWFYGRISDITIGRTKITIKVKSLLDILTIQMPRRLYQASCGWIFGAPGCDYDRVAGLNADRNAGLVGRSDIICLAGSNQNILYTSWVPQDNGWPSDSFDNGTIICLSGQNAGYTRTLGVLWNGYIYYLKPWIFPVVGGTDEFRLLPGCNHTLQRCTDYFNQNRFGGFPYIPPPETAI